MTMLRTTIALVVVGLCLAPERAGLAKNPADEATKRAKAHFKAGEAHFSLGEFSLALDEYRKAYQIRPLPPLLFNMAQCHRHLGENEKAVFLLRRFLATSPTDLQRSQAEAVLNEVELALKSQLDHKPPAAARTPSTQPLQSASAPAVDRAARLRTTRVVTRPAALPLVAAPVTTPREVTSPRTPLYKRWWLWTIVTGAAVATATAIAVAASRGDDLPKGTLPAVDYR